MGLVILFLLPQIYTTTYMLVAFNLAIVLLMKSRHLPFFMALFALVVCVGINAFALLSSSLANEHGRLSLRELALIAFSFLAAGVRLSYQVYYVPLIRHAVFAYSLKWDQVERIGVLNSLFVCVQFECVFSPSFHR
jgi:hypothetical protein